MSNKLANLGDDIEDKAINEEQMKVLKNVSTCDFIAMRRLFEQSKETVVTTSLIFTSNHLLKSFEKTEAYKRRVVWCPMFNKVDKKDPLFITKQTTPEALEYWLKLIIEAYLRLYENKKFTDSEKVIDYNEKYHEENNGTLTFIRDRTPDYFIGKRPPQVYDDYVIWAEENFGEGAAQSKKILKETIQAELSLIVKDKKVNGVTAKVYAEKQWSFERKDEVKELSNLLLLKDIKFVSNDQQDYIRRLERAYEQQQNELERLKNKLEGIKEYYPELFR